MKIVYTIIETKITMIPWVNLQIKENCYSHDKVICKANLSNESNTPEQ